MEKKIICFLVVFLVVGTLGCIAVPTEKEIEIEEIEQVDIIPVITNISPSQVTTETDVVNVVIKGRNFAGAAVFSGCGISPVSDYQGFQLKSCKEVSDTQINAQFGIANDITPGPRNITVTVIKRGTSNAVTFTVIPSAQPLINLISPNGGEKLVIGNTYNIKWTTIGYDFNTSVQIGLRDVRYDPNLAEGEAVIVNTINTGIYTWTIPSQLDIMKIDALGIYKIVIYIKGGGPKGYDESDNYFSITE